MATLPSALGGWIIGMLLAFHPMIHSRLALMQGDWADSRFNNYLLEHGYRWLGGMPGHERFWSPPMFFPVPNTAAYSDVLLSVAPFYWPWRLAGFAPDTSFQLWMLTVATLNYLAALVLFARGFRCRPLAAAVGATLFSFAAVRTAQLIHPQLIPQFYISIALIAMLRLFECGADTHLAIVPPERRGLWIALLGAAFVGQLYASYYYAWFLFFAMALAAIGAAVFPHSRRQLASVLRAELRAIVIVAFVAALVLVPLVTHYSQAARQVGMREFWRVDVMLPLPQSWAYMGPGSWLYGALAGREVFHRIPMEHEQRLGVGIATALFAAIGLWTARRRKAVQFATLVPLTMALVSTRWPGDHTLWREVFALVPGAAALRAVSRIGIAIVLPASLGVALLVDHLVRARDCAASGPLGNVRKSSVIRTLAAALILGAILVEQGQRLPAYAKADARERTARVADRIGAGCTAFLFASVGGTEDPWRYHVDAMWASMRRTIPTVNGYSGNEPPHWPFYDVRTTTPGLDLADSLSRWATRWRLDARTMCIVRVPSG